MTTKRIKDLSVEATSSTLDDNDYGVVDSTANGTRKFKLSELATWIINKWATFVNALASKTSFASGDKIPIVNGSTATTMEASKLLELTAQNALAGNVAPAFDPTRTEDNAYKIGEYVYHENGIFQFVKPHYGAWNASKVIHVATDDIISLCSNVFGPKNIHLIGAGSALLRTPLIPVVTGEVVTINIPANWDASSNPNDKNKFALNYYSDDEYTNQNIKVVGNGAVRSQYTYTVPSGVNYISFIARGEVGENIELSFALNEIDYIENKLTAFPFKIDHTFSAGGNDSLKAFTLYHCGANKFVRFKFTSDWTDESVVYNKLYIREVYEDGTLHDTVTLAAHSSIPLDLKYKTSKNCVSIILYVRGDANENVTCTISVEEIQQKHKIASTSVWRGNLEVAANLKPAFRDDKFTSRFVPLGFRCIPMQSGDSMWCEDGYRFYTAISSDGLTPYTTKGWITSSGWFLATSDCYMYVLFGSVGDADITDIADAVEAFTILTDGDTGISPVSEAVNAMRVHRSHVKGVNHRGFNKIAPENTIPAFEMSRDYGFRIVETDLRYSSDDVPVLIHDATVDRTSNGTGNVADMTLEQLKALDFGSWKSASYAGTKIPTFEELLDFVSNSGIEVFLEVKAGDYSKFSSLVLHKIVQRGLLDKFYIFTDMQQFITDANSAMKNAKLGILWGDDITGAITYFDGLPKTNGNLLFIASSNASVMDTDTGKNCPYPISTWTIDLSTTLLTQTPYYAVTSNSHDVSQELFAQSVAKVKSDIR